MLNGRVFSLPYFFIHTIKEVEKKLNISRANIRFYEKEDLLKPKRFDSNAEPINNTNKQKPLR